MSREPANDRYRILRRVLAVALTAAFVVVGSALRAVAQPPAPPEPSDPGGEVHSVGPDTYILLDAEGRPQPVLGMSYEEFVAAWRESQQLASKTAEPRFTLDALHLAGRANNDHAELDVEITLRLLADTPVRVPLGMASAILREQPRFTLPARRDGPADHRRAPYVDFDPRQGGFVAGISGEPDERFTISFPVLVPLVRDGNETTLRLNCPRALVSDLSLELPTPVAQATATEGVHVDREAGDSGTQLYVTGLAGDIQLTWSTAEPQRTDLATALSATGAVRIEIDGHSIRSDARLAVGSYGGAFDRFRVRLPPGATLIQHRPNDASAAPPPYRVTVETEPQAAAVDPPVVLVELAERQAGPIEVELSIEQPLGLLGADRAVELAGFEVVGAVRQFGDVAIHVADDWQSRWEIGANVRQVEPADLAPSLQATPPSAAFQYDRQPWSLRTRVAARPLRVHVAPEYALEIDADEARLHAHLAYQVPGARAFAFRVRLNGWQLAPEPIESGGLVSQDGVEVADDGMLILSLTQASPRRAEVSLWLRRDLPRDEPHITLPLPAPEADSLAAAELEIAAEPGIELLVDPTQSRGLSPTPVVADAPRPGEPPPPQVLHFRASLHDAVIAATRSRRNAAVRAAVESSLSLDPRQLELAQTIDYDVKYQAVDRLTLHVPSSWSVVDGQAEIVTPAHPADGSAPTTSPITLPAPTDQGAGGVSPLSIALPQPRMGSFAVRLRYRAAWSEDSPDAGRIALPLPRPAECDVITHRVRIAGPLAAGVTLDPAVNGAAWQAAGTPAGAEFVATSDQALLPLLIQAAAVDRPEATVIQRVWLQTWQGGATIQNRAAFRFESMERLATVELPPAVSAPEVEVLLDGRLADVAARERGRLTVSLPRASRNSRISPTHTLELRYRRPAGAGLVVREVLTPPQLVGSSALNEVYWHIVLPGDRHVIRAPEQLAPADRWQWFGAFWGRHPAKSQVELETWAGATAHSPPTAAQGEYLYSGLAPVASIVVVTAPRWLIVLAASGVALAVGLLWVYVPAVRRAWIALVVALVLAALAVAYPTPALLLAQASLAGWILATIAVLLRRRVSESTVRMSSTSGSTNLRLRTLGRPESMAAPALPTPSGTPTAPLSTAEPNR